MGNSKQVNFLFALVIGGCGPVRSSESSPKDGPSSPFKTFTVQGMPGSAEHCSEIANEVGSRFERATGINPYRTECAAGEDGVDVAVTYVSSERLPRLQAEFGLFGSNDPDPTFPTGLDRPLWGTDSSYSSCVERLEEKRADFERQTETVAVAWSCVLAMHSGYAARIDGFGKDPARRFYNLEVEFQGAADQAFADEVAELFAAQGATVKKVVPWGGNVIVMFYAAEPVRVDAKTVGYRGQVETMAGCKQELAEAREALTQIMGQAPAIATCLPDSYDASAHVNFAFGTQVQLPGYWQETGPVYRTLSDCSGDRVHLLEEFRRATGRNARASVCVMESTILPSKYEAVLIGTNP